MKRSTFLTVVVVVFIGLLMRLYGLNWDQGQHLHPDERFLTLVAEKIRTPTSIAQYFDSKTSPLNPYNNGFTFYVYGTFPLFITRIVADIFQMNTYNNLFLIGRALSTLFDVGTGILVYLISKRLFANHKAAISAAFVYMIAVLPLQQSHFFTVDSFLVFFSTSTLLFFITHLKEKKLLSLILSGLFFGLTVANKTSLIITAPLFYMALLFIQLKKPVNFLNCALLFTLCWTFAFRIFQPYAFAGLLSLSPTFISNIIDAHKMVTGEINYPPNVQWTGTLPLLHPLIQIALWGYGPVATIFAGLGVFFLSRKKKIIQTSSFIFLSLFSIGIFAYQGVQLAKYMRYFYPIYPFLAILTGYAVSKVATSKKITTLIFFSFMVWPVCFLSIYQGSHSRVQASNWIYQNIPKGSTITSEDWDDSLPLNIGSLTNQDYATLPLPMFQEDSKAKWNTITKQLAQTDYIILSSNRVFGSVTHRPTVYPITNRYYELLLNGSLGFKPVKTVTSYPSFGSLRIDDSRAEESFTVYDHPQIFIFKKTARYSGDDIMKLLF